MGKDPETLKDLPPKILPKLEKFVLEEFLKLVSDFVKEEIQFTVGSRPAPLPYDRAWQLLRNENGYEYRIIVGIQAYPKR